MGWPWSWVGKRKRSIIWVAEKFPSRVFTWPATSWMKSYTRWRGSSSSRAWEKLRLLRPYIPFSSLMFSK